MDLRNELSKVLQSFMQYISGYASIETHIASYTVYVLSSMCMGEGTASPVAGKSLLQLPYLQQ